MVPGGLDVEADRHQEVAVPVVASLQQSWPKRADEAETQLVAGDAVHPVAQELGVEADLERLAVEGDGQ